MNRSAGRRTHSGPARSAALFLLLSVALVVTELSGAPATASASPQASSVASAATAASLSAAAARPAAKKKRWKPKAGVKFNVPRVGGERQFRLERQVIDAINHAHRGSIIRMSMFSFDRMPVADALIRAKRKRKVQVQVIVNGHEFPAAQRKMRKALGKKRSKASFFYQCKASCRGQGDVNHSKFVLFSSTGAARKTVMLGSLNMKLNGSENQFNDLLTINGNAKMYDTLDKVFAEMKRDRLAHPSYFRKNIDARYQLSVLPFPRKGAATRKTKWTVSRDPISRLLAPIKCRGADTSNGRTIVRVNMHAWDGDRGVMIAKKFRDLYARGCDVKIQVGYAGGKVRQVFSTPTGRGFMPVRSTGFDTDEDDEIDLYSHEKILLVNGKYGNRLRKMVVTGSSNYQNGGQYGDELILRVFDFRLYRSYADNWGWSWRNHTHGFSWGMAPRSARLGISSFGLDGIAGGMAPILTDGLGIDSEEWRDE